MAEFVKVATDEEIPTGTTKAFEIGHHRFVIAHTEDGFFGIADQCTHDAEPINDGSLEGNEIVCRRHGAKFNVKTGAVTAPPAIVPLDTFEVKVENNDILILLD